MLPCFISVSKLLDLILPSCCQHYWTSKKTNGWSSAVTFCFDLISVMMAAEINRKKLITKETNIDIWIKDLQNAAMRCLTDCHVFKVTLAKHQFLHINFRN